MHVLQFTIWPKIRFNFQTVLSSYKQGLNASARRDKSEHCWVCTQGVSSTETILYNLKQAENGRKDLPRTFHATQSPFPKSVPCSLLIQEADIRGHQDQKLLHMENLMWFIIFTEV